MTQHLTPGLAEVKLTAAGHVYADLTSRVRIAYRLLNDAQPGYPSGGGGASGKNTVSDRTGNLAVNEPDAARAALDELDMRVRRICTDIIEAERIARSWQYPNKEWTEACATEAARNLTDDRWCVSCLRIGSMSTRRKEGGDLCRWCADTLRTVDRRGQLPTWLVEKHAQGKRITDADIDRARRDMGSEKRRSSRSA